MNTLDFTIKSKSDSMKDIDRLGFLPFFTNSISGFSLEEHIEPQLWFTDIPGPWECKGPVISEMCCAYGKFFEKKAAYISREWFPDFANFRRDGYDFDARFDDELAAYKDKVLYDLVAENAPILSKQLKEIGNYGKDGKKGFDTIITRLQKQCYVVISDFVYLNDKNGKAYGWGVAEYSTPELFMGSEFTDKVYNRTPQESYERVFEHFKEMFPCESDDAIKRFLK